jgi:Neurotransmitter-gated ion-channel transmembrane region
MTIYVISSVLFVVISYCSYWIDYKAATARCSLAITTIVITINVSNGISNMLPPIAYPIWLETYYTGCLIFTCVTMLEYAIVNFSAFNFNNYELRIEETITTIKYSVGRLKRKYNKVVEDSKFA